MPDSLSLSTSGPGNVNTDQVYADFKAQAASAAADRKKLGDEFKQERDTEINQVKGIQDMSTAIPVVKAPELSGSPDDHNPNKYWDAGHADVKQGYDHNDFKKMAMAVVGMLALGAVTGNGAVSLAGLGGVMQGFVAGRDKRNQTALEKWKADADQVAIHNQQLNDIYTAKLNDRAQTLQTRLAQMNAIAVANHDYMMAQASLAKDGENMALHLIGVRAMMAATVIRANPEKLAEDMYEKKRKAYTDEANAYQKQAKNLRDQADTIRQNIGKTGSTTLFDDKGQKQVYDNSSAKFKQLMMDDLQKANALDGEAQKQLWHAKLYERKSADLSQDNPDISEAFTNAGASPGDVARVDEAGNILPSSSKQGKPYIYDDQGAHPLTEAQFQAHLKGQAEAGQVDAAGAEADDAANPPD